MKYPLRVLRRSRWLWLHVELFPGAFERSLRQIASAHKWQIGLPRDRRTRESIRLALEPMGTDDDVTRWVRHGATVRQCILLYTMCLNLIVNLAEWDDNATFQTICAELEGPNAVLGLARAALDWTAEW